MMAMLGVATALALLGTVALAGRIFVLKSMQPNFDNWHRIPGTTPVVVALTNKLPRRKLDVVIVRRANINPQDLILSEQAARLFGAVGEPKEIQSSDAGHRPPDAAVPRAAACLDDQLRATR